MANIEEPDRLIPQIIEKGMVKEYPPLVQPDISRDFVYIDDAIYATLLAANANFSVIGGRSINIAPIKKPRSGYCCGRRKKFLRSPVNLPGAISQTGNGILRSGTGNAGLAKELLNWEQSLI
jgi:dolichol-phosphate mannosyltransferase